VAPVLQALELDVYRNCEWPLDTLRALSFFSNITHLKIHFDLHKPYKTYVAESCIYRTGSAACNRMRLVEPELNATSALVLFRFMRSSKVGAELRDVDFIAGECWRPEGDGLRLADCDEYVHLPQALSMLPWRGRESLVEVIV